MIGGLVEVDQRESGIRRLIGGDERRGVALLYWVKQLPSQSCWKYMQNEAVAVVLLSDGYGASL
jgi:hypothetical protein